jgi:hypothetical protein
MPEKRRKKGKPVVLGPAWLALSPPPFPLPSFSPLDHRATAYGPPPSYKSNVRAACNLHGPEDNFNGCPCPLLLQLRPRPAAGVSVCLSKEPLPAGLLPTWQGGGARGQSVPRAARAARTAVSENVTGPAPRSAHSIRGFAGQLLGTIKRI